MLNCHQCAGEASLFCIHEWEETLWACFHVVVLTTSLALTIKITPPCSPPIVGGASEGVCEGAGVCLFEWGVCMCVCVCGVWSGGGTSLVTQVHRGFPRCYFLLPFAFVLLSHHMLWLVLSRWLSFLKVKACDTTLFPCNKACPGPFSWSKLELFRSTLLVSSATMLSFQSL